MSKSESSWNLAEIASQLLQKYKKQVVEKIHNTSETHTAHRILSTNGFARQIDGLYKETCFKYDADPNVFSAVMDAIDLDLIYKNVDSNQESEVDYEKALVVELLRYFKEDFFTWTNQPKCRQCGETSSQDLAQGEGPNLEERQEDPKISMVEVYRCRNCQVFTRFPRYNSPYMLLKTKTGRCGEWANLFLFFLKSFGITSRYVWNKEDHVWCEYYNDKEKRWIHLDPCENSYDQPYIYSKNWNKKMTYCFAFGNDVVMDVSNKYIVVKENALPRTEIKEGDLQVLFSELSKSLRKGLRDDDLYKLDCRDQLEFIELHGEQAATSSSTAPLGRVSGSAAWKSARGEGGH